MGGGKIERALLARRLRPKGLPPQCWEYIVTKSAAQMGFCIHVRIARWRRVTYRSNRHFDILNENIVFSTAIGFHGDDYREQFSRRGARPTARGWCCSQQSHDEQTYTIVSGAHPPHGVQRGGRRADDFLRRGAGRDTFPASINTRSIFGKNIPQFKTYNSCSRFSIIAPTA